MTRRSSGVFTAALAVAFFAANGAGAETARWHKRHHVQHRTVADAHQHKGFPSYLDVGAPPDVGSDNRYYSDTLNPHYLLSPGVFQRFE